MQTSVENCSLIRKSPLSLKFHSLVFFILIGFSVIHSALFIPLTKQKLIQRRRKICSAASGLRLQKGICWEEQGIFRVLVKQQIFLRSIVVCSPKSTRSSWGLKSPERFDQQSGHPISSTFHLIFLIQPSALFGNNTKRSKNSHQLRPLKHFVFL